jgi:hypothetical protein
MMGIEKGIVLLSRASRRIGQSWISSVSLPDKINGLRHPLPGRFCVSNQEK